MEFGTTFQFSTANAINCNLSYLNTVPCQSTSSTVLWTDLTNQRSAINQPGLRASAVIIAIENCCYSPLDLNPPPTQWNVTRPGRLYVCFSPWPITSKLPSESLERNHAMSSCKGERSSKTLCIPRADCSYNTRSHARVLLNYPYKRSRKSLAACIGRRVWPFALAVCYFLLLKNLWYCACRGNSEVQCPVCRTQMPLDNCKVYAESSLASPDYMSLTASHMKYAFALRLQAGCGQRLRRTHDSRFRWTRVWQPLH